MAGGGEKPLLTSILPFSWQRLGTWMRWKSGGFVPYYKLFDLFEGSSQVDLMSKKQVVISLLRGPKRRPERPAGFEPPPQL